MPNRIAIALLAFVSFLEAVNVGAAIITGRGTLPAVDILFTSTGGAVLTEALRQNWTRNNRPSPPQPPPPGGVP